MDKLLYRVPEAAEVISISRSKMYELVRTGEVETVTVGRSRRVPADALRTLVERLRLEAAS